MTYRLNDIYACMQGEGARAGTPMALIRLQGCGVGCPWCDTRETWAADEAHRVDAIPAALGTGPAWCRADPVDIADAARAAAPSCRWAMLTGGEPAEQPLAPLVHALHGRGFLVALETSGTALGHVGAGIDWCCVSPKPGMPGGRALLAPALAVADEVKMVVGRPADIDALDAILAATPPRPDARVSLQPLSSQPKATLLCTSTAILRGWHLSLQLHKYLGQR